MGGGSTRIAPRVIWEISARACRGASARLGIGLARGPYVQFREIISHDVGGITGRAGHCVRSGQPCGVEEERGGGVTLYGTPAP